MIYALPDRGRCLLMQSVSSRQLLPVFQQPKLANLFPKEDLTEEHFSPASLSRTYQEKVTNVHTNNALLLKAIKYVWRPGSKDNVLFYSGNLAFNLNALYLC